MARIRTIKPETFDDPDLCALPPLARWLFVGLWTQADKAGRLEDDPRRLKVRLLPYDDADIDALLDALAPKFITRYTVDGQNYIHVNNFQKHQHAHPKEPDSKLPGQAVEKHGKARKRRDEPGKIPARTGNAGSSRVDSGCLMLDSGCLTLDAGVPSTARSARSTEDAFDAFWARYPKKVGKGAARVAWAKVNPDAALAGFFLDAVDAQMRSAQWLRDGGRFIPNPATWLHQQRWDDQPDPEVPQLNDKTLATMRAGAAFLRGDHD